MHIPVMSGETLSYLNLKPGKVILDCTVGCGGHAAKILENIIPGGKLIGIDRDESAVEEARKNLSDFNGNFKLVSDNFANLDRVLERLDIKKVDACLLDLGISSAQLENPDRGFSIKYDGPLDMRMDRREATRALDIVNKLPEYELADILRKFGEERFSKSIARRIARQRSKEKISTTWRLAGLVTESVPARYRTRRIHPATRTFQALRIVVNRELVNLETFLGLVPAKLKKNGRICVISFHSLEDRIVKQFFKEAGGKKILKIITKKPETPTPEEIDSNPRARSAKLRVAEKI